MDRSKSKSFMKKLNLNAILQKKHSSRNNSRNNSIEVFETNDRINLLEGKIQLLNNRIEELQQEQENNYHDYSTMVHDFIDRLYHLYLEINESSRTKIDIDKEEIRKFFMSYTKLNY